MYTDTLIRTILRKDLVLFKTTLANNLATSVVRFWELLVNMPYLLLVTLWSYFKSKIISLLFP